MDIRVKGDIDIRVYFATRSGHEVLGLLGGLDS
jgi:hypothetical protein